MLKNVKITTTNNFVLCWDHVYRIIRLSDDYVSVRVGSIDGPIISIHLDPYFEGRIKTITIDYEEE